MKFDNSKRMNAVQDFLREDSKKKLQAKKQLKKQRSGLSSSNHSSGSVSSGRGKSLRSSGSTASSSSSSHGSNADDSAMCYKNILALQKSWEHLKTTVDAATLGEHVILLMIQAHGEQARTALQLESLRSERCGELSKQIVEVMDVFIFLVEPTIEDAELTETLEPLVEQGIRAEWLAAALPLAVQECSAGKSLSDKERAAWNETMTTLLLRSIPLDS